MMKSVIAVNGKMCGVYAADAPEYVIIQPTGEHETALLDEETERIFQNTEKRICFVSFPIADWNSELSPWKAKQAYGEDYFGDGAAHTLNKIESCLIPALQKQINIPNRAKYIMGGYSLAGLFSLWAAYQTGFFHAAAACSPSVWIDGWREYVESHSPLTKLVYLSLGTKEHKTRNPVLQTVKQAVIHQSELLEQSGIHTVLEWNQGNHFQDYTGRMSRAYLRILHADEESGMKTVNVAAAVICDSFEKPTRIFAVARGYGAFQGMWEFPGGKTEAGETSRQAVVREVKEELDVTVEAGDLIDTVEFDYPTFHLHMDCFWCKITDGDIVLKEAADARWMKKDELYDVNWLPADIALIDKIAAYLTAVC